MNRVGEQDKRVKDFVEFVSQRYNLSVALASEIVLVAHKYGIRLRKANESENRDG